ncbi:MAG: glycosyltransferase family 2 protein [Verrucomicrobia bacterium]|nr:glycosyltransferase family 2 protein [Verrucomicrobiota bacterium]
MSTPQVSVVLPTHNRADMLARAIQSVLSQTFTDFELLVISDHCEDHTAELVRGLKDNRIRYLENRRNPGASGARNTGLEESRAPYIAFLDDDDEWTADKLEVQLPVLQSSPPSVGLVYAWMDEYDDRKQKVTRTIAPTLRGDVLPHMLDKQAIGACPTIIIKREAMERIGLFDEELLRGNDGNYWRRISRHFEVDYVPKILCRVHIGHSDRISIESVENVRKALFALEKRRVTFSAELDQYPEAGAALYSRIMCLRLKVHRYHDAFKACRRLWAHPVSFRRKVRLTASAVREWLATSTKRLLIAARLVR